MFVLSSESILEYFRQEKFARQSLKTFELLKISIQNNSFNSPSFLLKINGKKEKNKNKKIKMSSKRLLDNSQKEEIDLSKQKKTN